MTAQRQHAIVESISRTADSDRQVTGDEFLGLEDLVPVKRDAAERTARQAFAELLEFIRENKWEDAVNIFYPVEEKLPETVEHGLDAEIRAKLAFVLGQINRFDDAIRELSLCVRRDADNFHLHSSLAYTAYNSLYAAANREIFLRGKIRAKRIELAHRHFEKARELRPDGVTNFYREGMLFKQIEKKTEKALPLFQKAISNWDNLAEEQKQARHQERKNFIKALYHLASSLLERGRPHNALEMIRRCLSEDEKSNYMSPLFKYFALGKASFHMNSFSEARDALLFALERSGHQPKDFVYELLGRTYLALEEPSTAMEIINRVPEKKRRPYYRWTEADILCALKDFQGAKKALVRSQERDNRSRHKALIRLAKIEYLMGNYQKCMDCAVEAEKFFREKWGNSYDDGLFWQALSAYRLGREAKAVDLALELKRHNPWYPKLDALLARLF